MDLLRNLLKGDKVIWIIFAALCMISVIEVFSAASSLTYRTGDHLAPITQHVTILMVGVVVVIMVHIIPYKWFPVFPVFLLPVSFVMLLIVATMGFITGDRVNGAARWMTFLGIQFQPSELAKMAVIIAVSFLLSKRQGDDDGIFKYIMIITGIICVLIAPENLSTALLLLGVVMLLMFIGQIAVGKLLKLLGSVALIGAFFIGLSYVIPKDSKIPFLHRLPTWRNRVINFTLNEDIPAAQYDINKNGQIAHARIAIASSNLTGKMPGNSVQRDFLSQAFSDFIFAIIIEELGLIGGGLVVILYILLLIRAGRIARKCNRTFPAFLVMGIALMLVSQALLNMMVAVGLFPVTGQPLPLISKGGTSTLINCAYIGMILSISRYTILLEKEKKDAAKAADEMLQAAEPTSDLLNSDSEFEETNR
jgi:cell division protein FtsW